MSVLIFINASHLGSNMVDWASLSAQFAHDDDDVSFDPSAALPPPAQHVVRAGPSAAPPPPARHVVRAGSRRPRPLADPADGQAAIAGLKAELAAAKRQLKGARGRERRGAKFRKTTGQTITAKVDETLSKLTFGMRLRGTKKPADAPHRF